MNDVVELRARLGRFFESSFRVGDLAESLISFDAERPAAEVLAVLQRRRFREAGVREGGAIGGYVLAADLERARGPCGDLQRDFDPAEVLPGDTHLTEAVQRLAERERLFVTAFGRVAGIVTWSDLQKPPMRMWLFGMITLVEMGLAQMIEAWYPEESWTARVPAGRRARAQALLDERRRRGASSVRLIDCLQLADKAQLLNRDEETRRLLGFPSRTAGERSIRNFAALRDNLAHSQDIVGEGWQTIVGLARNLDEILRLGTTFPARPRSRAER